MTGNNDTANKPAKQQTAMTTAATATTATITTINNNTATAATTQPIITNGPHTNGYMPQKSPPMSNYRKTPPGSHGKPSPLMQRRMEVNA